MYSCFDHLCTPHIDIVHMPNIYSDKINMPQTNRSDHNKDLDRGAYPKISVHILDKTKQKIISELVS